MARKNYVQYPQRAFLRPLTHAQHHILACLCLLDYRTAHGDGHDRFFSITDRDLANFVGCHRFTITEAKHALVREKLIATWTGPDTRSCYRILYEDPI